MSTEEPRDSAAGKRKVRADPHRVMAWVDNALQRRTIQLAVTGALVLGLALLLGTRIWAKASLLERLKPGARAEGNIKATHDFEYMPSTEKLEQERSVAVEKILPVFDYQTDFATNVVSRIGKAFGRMAPADAGVEPEKPAVPAKAAKGPKAAKAEEGKPAPSEQRESEAEDRRRQFAEALQVEVSPQDFKILRRANFGSEARSLLQVMVGSATNQMVVSTRGVLEPFKDKPILVRHLVMGRPGRGGEEKIADLVSIKDVQQVREDLRLQASVHTAKLPTALAKVVEGLALRLVDSNLVYNRSETEARREAARQSVKLSPVSVTKGQVIVRDGDVVTKEHWNILSAMESWRKGTNVVQEIVGLGLFVLLLLMAFFFLARAQFMRFYTRPRDLVVMGVLLVALLGLAKGVVSVGAGVQRGQELPISLYVIPLAAGAMLTRLLISAESAVLFATVLSALCGLLMDRSLGIMVFYLVTSLVGASGVARVQSRSTILRAGLMAGVAGAGVLVGLRLFQGQMAELDTLYALFGGVAGGVLAAFMTLALLPAVEWLFAYTTDVTLLELANLNHPLLRDLILRAPGTYHHSMIVGNLSEAACESIGANGLLARVASYYHDIGKVKNAVYFAENFKPAENPHNRLKPSMSALIIRSHVKDTIEMLREHGVPELVIETATQHHGKTLIEFFYHKASEAKEEGEEIHEEDYRYPGPKPQSREAGVIMLADGVEAAARSLQESTEDRLRAVVQRVINAKFTDGQLDHCDLTLRDLHLIAKSFLQVLRGIYHQRPTYPWQKETKDGRKEEGKPRDTAKMRTVEREASDEEETGKRKAKGEPPASGKKARTDQTKDGKKTKSDAKAAKGKDQDAKKDGDGEGKHKGKRDSGPLQAAKREPEPEGPGKGSDAAEPGVPKEAETESSQDIKRLGLS